MSLLTLVTRFCERTNVPTSNAVMASTDTQIIQIRSLLEELGDDLAKRGEWEGMTFEQSFTTIAAEDQGTIAAIANEEFRSIKNQTIWSHTRRLPVAGPLDARQWQALKALFVNGPYYRFRIRGGHLLVNPTPPAGESWFFEYVTKDWILDEDGVTLKQYFTKDTDTVLLPEELVLMGLRWYWKAEKGLDYAENMRTYEMQVKDAAGRDGAKPVLCMDEGMRQGPQPGIFVPQGSWTIP
jgi:hypothetical protein